MSSSLGLEQIEKYRSCTWEAKILPLLMIEIRLEDVALSQVSKCLVDQANEYQ